MKKVLALVLSLTLVATLTIGGSIAYLQDDDSDVNVMTLGKVTIDQHEYERVKDADGKFGTDLQDFTQVQNLMPAVYDIAGVEDPARQEITVGEYTITYGGGMRTFPNYVDKLVTVENTGKSDAYVRTLIAVPVTNGKSDDVSDQWLHYNIVVDTDTTPRNGWYAGKTKNDGECPSVEKQNYAYDVEIDGNTYEVYVATNVNVLEPGKTTGPCLAGFYLDNDVDYEEGVGYTALDKQGNRVTVWEEDTVELLILTQAVQAQGFSDAYVALNAAYGEITKENAEKWFGGIMGNTANEGDFELLKDTTLVNEPLYQTTTATESYTIDGNGHTVTGVVSSADEFTWTGSVPDLSTVFSSDAGAKVTVNDITFTGTMSAVMAGNYVNTSSNWFNTEFNNVDIVDAEVVSFSGGISPALVVYGNLVMNDCTVKGTELSELDNDPMWPVYDVAVVNMAKLIANNSTFGSIMGGEQGTGHYWGKSYIELNNSTADVIYACGRANGGATVINEGSKVEKVVASQYAIVLKIAEGATVETLDLTKITDLAQSTLEIEGTVNRIIDGDVEYDSIEAWKAAQ